MAGKNRRFKDRKKQFKRSTDSAQKGSEKKDRDDTDDEAEKKEGKATPKLKFNRAPTCWGTATTLRGSFGRSSLLREYLPLLNQIPESVRDILTTWMPLF